jgi:hypothetical protein
MGTPAEQELGQVEKPTLQAVVPYLMFLSAISILGLLFLVLNAPLFLEFFKPESPTNMLELLRAEAKWYRTVIAPSATHVTITLLLSLPLGFAVQQFSGMLATLTTTVTYGAKDAIINLFECKLVRLPHAKTLATKLKDFRLFSASRFLEDYHGTFKIWLLRNRTEKLEWEWEFFNYTMYWGLFANASICLILVNFFTAGLSEHSGLVFGTVLWAFFALQAIIRSRTMQLVHEQCVAKAGITKPFTR